jgi:hypothetical protein
LGSFCSTIELHPHSRTYEHSTYNYYILDFDVIDNHVQYFPVTGMQNRAYFFVGGGIRAHFTHFFLTADAATS